MDQPDLLTLTPLRSGPSRREFVAMSAAAGLAGEVPLASAALPVQEHDVQIRTPDGQCDAAFFHPASGRHPGVLVWTDAFGLRPSMRDIARRLAAEGYAVLVPNPFYRVAKAPVFESASSFDFAKPEDRARLQPFMGSINAPGAAEKDAQAYIAFLDAQPQVDTRRKIGAQGYCMGGALVLRTAAAVPQRVGAGASLHGGGLVTDQPGSPHRLAPQIKARLYIGVASNDDQRQPQAKDVLKEAFAQAGVPATVEVYPAKHGWCVPDMPVENGAPIYSQADADRAGQAVLALYRQALA